MNTYMIIYRNHDTGRIVTAFAKSETLYRCVKQIPTFKTLDGLHYSMIEVKLDE